MIYSSFNAQRQAPAVPPIASDQAGACGWALNEADGLSARSAETPVDTTDVQPVNKKKNDHGCAPWSFREPIALKT
jgi:hypothetical protein